MWRCRCCQQRTEYAMLEAIACSHPALKAEVATLAESALQHCSRVPVHVRLQMSLKQDETGLPTSCPTIVPDNDTWLVEEIQTVMLGNQCGSQHACHISASQASPTSFHRFCSQMPRSCHAYLGIHNHSSINSIYQDLKYSTAGPTAAEARQAHTVC